MVKSKDSPKGKDVVKATAVRAATHKTMSSIKSRLATFVAKGKERADAIRMSRTPLPASLRKRKNSAPHEIESDDEEDTGRDEVEHAEDQADLSHQSEESEVDQDDESQEEDEETRGSDADFQSQTDDATDESGELEAESKHTITYGFTDNGSHIPPDPRERSKNGRRVGRNLIIWNRPCMNEKFLLIYHYENVRHGLEVPMEAVAHRMNPGSSASAANQHFNRLRDEVLGKGHLVPPPLVRSKNYEIVDEHLVRGYIRVDKPGSQRIQVRAVSFDEHLPDNQHNRVGFNSHEKMGDNVWERADLVDKNGNVLMTSEERKHGKANGSKVRMAVLQQAKKTTKGSTKPASSSTSKYASSEDSADFKISAIPDVAARARNTRKMKSASKTKNAAARETAFDPTLEASDATKAVPAMQCQHKKRKAIKSTSTSPSVESCSSDADYDPTGRVASKRSRPSRSKRVKTYHETDHGFGLEEANSSNFLPTAAFETHVPTAHPVASLNPNHPGMTHTTASPDGTVAPDPEQPQLLTNGDTATLEAPMPEMIHMDPGIEAISPPVANPGILTPIDSSQYAQSSRSPLSSPSDLSSCGVEEFNPSVDIITNFQIQQANNSLHHQGYLPMSAFIRNDFSPPSFVGRGDGVSPSSGNLAASSSNSEFFFGHNRGFSGSVHKPDPEMVNMAGIGGFVYPHQTFGMNMGPMISQGMGSEQGLVSGPDIHNMQVYHNHGFPDGGI
ncbi:chaperonin [Sporothrix epigloea]|uniref:Chaperonin n=1 Tax=Sporothrix epigloea TaxID=1892477 RepID=A0ABP0DGZ5_9PEZI